MPDLASAANAQSRLKRRVHAKRKTPDIDAAPASMLFTREQASEVCGFSVVTLKNWDLAGQGKGPKVTRIEGWPRYRAADLRAWLAGEVAK